MKLCFDDVIISASDETALKAAAFLAEEFELRTGKKPRISEKSDEKNPLIELKTVSPSQAEDFSITQNGDRVTVTAHRLRGLIYGYSFFLRKCTVSCSNIYLTEELNCTKTPKAKIRGHQLSYTDMNNTCDKWMMADFERYYRDLMFFGMNTVEATTGKMKRNSMMKYDFPDSVRLMSELCIKYDLNFSLWHPVDKSMTDEEALSDLIEKLGGAPKLDYLFPPGGDPGDMEPEAFIERCRYFKRELRKIYPSVQLWPSAQAPGDIRDWGERFISKMNELPDEIDGIIYGPNHAMPLDELRRRLPARYPLRFYPDITHNVRCEYPVHFYRDDWHYAFAATLSRESVNPRPCELQLLHRVTRQYFVGSVSYSEGCHDDFNKAVYSALDFDYECDLKEIAEDYVRAYIYDANPAELADAVMSLESNWDGAPEYNTAIERCYSAFETIAERQPELMNNWRFVLHFFRAECDKLVRDRRIFELKLIEEASKKAACNPDEVLKILETDFDESYKALRSDIDKNAKRLFELLGIQLDVKTYGGMGWERGCTLDTIDNPITDRRYLIKKIRENPDCAVEYFCRNQVDKDEYYFSFAEHGFGVIGKQNGEFYMNFRGDSNFDAELPMCTVKVYDHFCFSGRVAGLCGGDYKLNITYKERKNDEIKHHRVVVNRRVIHDGGQFGGEIDREFTEKHLAPGFVRVSYDIPADCLENGCALIEITEPIDGFQICEFSFTKANKG